AYGFLSQVVAEAHRRNGVSFETQDHDGRVHSGPGGRLPCMITTEELRTVRVELESGLILTPSRSEVPFTEADIPVLKDRYGEPPQPFNRAPDPFEFAAALVSMAKKVLETDGYHLRLIHVHTPHGWVMR